MKDNKFSDFQSIPNEGNSKRIANRYFGSMAKYDNASLIDAFVFNEINIQCPNNRNEDWDEACNNLTCEMS